MTDYQWLKQHISNPSEYEIYFFVERVNIILNKYVMGACSEKNLEDARKQAYEELKAHDF
jgi:hypothetical protein